VSFLILLVIDIDIYRYDIIGDIRGLGLMVGVQFDGKKVKYGTSGIISKECTKQGMLLLTTSVFETLRFIPPLVATKEEIDLGLNIFEKAIQNTLPQIKN
jgi:4-aminobutyrate aminotransferase-like enzyme